MEKTPYTNILLILFYYQLSIDSTSHMLNRELDQILYGILKMIVTILSHEENGHRFLYSISNISSRKYILHFETKLSYFGF